ncbi:MAG: GatB/YqeY domain-containing protein [Chloroflexota bacterium]|nr:GatB/YqeY domain-containing protein [Chloroflexota bacterium]
MTLYQRLEQDLADAIRQRDEMRRDSLRMAIAAAYNAQKTAGRTLTDDEVVSVLAREIKTRRESIEAFADAGRADTAAQEQAKLEILAQYMPTQLSEDELGELVRQAIEQTGATSARDMGRVMASVMPKVRGRAEGRQVNALVARELARRDVESHRH